MREMRELDVFVGDQVCTINDEDDRWLIERLRETYPGAEGKEEEPAFVLAWALELA